MFSGIITAKEKSLSLTKNANDMRVILPIPKSWKIMPGESISVDGICSTVEKIEKGTFTVFYMAETLRRTSLLALRSDHFFNLERCLTLKDLIGGHLVSGHVDTTGKVLSIISEGEAKIVKIALPSSFTKYIVYKGSIAVNGVSLTVASVDKDSFTVSLIPYTLTHTNLGELGINSVVNLEIDMIAKYIEKLSSPLLART